MFHFNVPSWHKEQQKAIKTPGINTINQCCDSIRARYFQILQHRVLHHFSPPSVMRGPGDDHSSICKKQDLLMEDVPFGRTAVHRKPLSTEEMQTWQSFHLHTHAASDTKGCCSQAPA